MLDIKNDKGILIPVQNIVSGHLKALASFDDYGIKAGETYKVKHDDEIGSYVFFGSEETMLWRNELRQDVADQLIWIND